MNIKVWGVEIGIWSFESGGIQRRFSVLGVGFGDEGLSAGLDGLRYLLPAKKKGGACLFRCFVGRVGGLECRVVTGRVGVGVLDWGLGMRI